MVSLESSGWTSRFGDFALPKLGYTTNRSIPRCRATPVMATAVAARSGTRCQRVADSEAQYPTFILSILSVSLWATDAPRSAIRCRRRDHVMIVDASDHVMITKDRVRRLSDHVGHSVINVTCERQVACLKRWAIWWFSWSVMV